MCILLNLSILKRGTSPVCEIFLQQIKKRFLALRIPRHGRGLTQFCARRAHFLSPPRGVLPSPPFSFRRRSRHGASTPRRRVSASDAGSPCVGRPESIQSKGAPTAPRSGEQRDGAAWRYQRKIVGARLPVILPEAKMRPDTPQSLPGSALTQQGGGPGGTSSSSGGALTLEPPGAFLLDRQAARSLFPRKREWGAESASPWGRKKCGLWPQRKVRPAHGAESIAPRFALF